MGTSPVFSEVIGVTFDTNSFAASIEKLKEMWTAAMTEMSGKSPIVGMANMDQVSSAIARTGEEIKQLGAEYLKVLEGVSGKVADVVAGQTNGMTAVVKETSAAGKTAARDIVDAFSLAASQSEEAMARALTAIDGYLKKGFNPKDLTRQAQSRTHNYISSGNFEESELNARQLQWYEDKANKAAALDVKEAELAEKSVQRSGKIQAAAEAYDKKLDENEAKVERRAGVKQSIAEQMNETMDRKQALQVVAAENMDVQITQRQEKEIQHAGKVQSAAEKMDDDRTQRQGRMISTAEQMDARIEASAQSSGQRMAAQRNAAYSADDDRFRESVAEKIRSEEEDLSAVGRLSKQRQEIYRQERSKYIDEWNAAYKENGAREKPSFMSSFKENFSPERIGQYAGMSAAFMVIGSAIGLAAKAASELVGQFKSGFEYLSDLEMKAALLQGVIATNIKLSSDFATNYKLAGEAATEVQQKMQDASIKYGITTEILDRSFKQFVDGGGASLVNSIGEAVQLTNMFAVALQAAGKDADTSRAIMSELPKLMNGTAKPSSFILETLGLTNVQWKAMVEHAKTHHDLLAQLTPLMQNYLNVAADAANRNQSLMESISLTMKRIMADGEKDAFALWKETLKEIKDFLDQHKVTISAIAAEVMSLITVLGSVVASAWRFLDATTAINTILKIAGVLFLGLVEDIVIGGKGMAVILNITAKWIDLLTDPAKWLHFKDSFKEAVDYSKSQVDEFGKALDDSSDRMNRVITGRDPRKGNVVDQTMDYLRDPLNMTEHSKNTTDQTKEHLNNDPVRILTKQMEEKLAVSKRTYDDEVEKNNLLLAQRKLSIEEVDKLNSQAARDEYDRQMHIIADTRADLSHIKGAKPASITQMQSTLNTKATGFGDAEHTRINQEDIKTAHSNLTVLDKSDEDKITEVKKVTDAQIAEFGRLEKAHQISQRQQLDDTKLWSMAEKNTVDSLYNNLIASAGKDAELHQKYTDAKAAYDAQYNQKVEQFAAQRLAIEQKEAELGTAKKVEQAKVAEEAILREAERSSHSTNQGVRDMATTKSLKAVADYAKVARDAAQANLDWAKSNGIVDEELQKLQAKLDALQNELDQANNKVGIDRTTPSGSQGNQEAQAVTNLSDTLKSGGDFATTVNGFASAIDIFHQGVSQIIQGFKQGGALGGIGAIASQAGDMMSKLGLPMVGAITSAIGGIMSSISSLFQARAKAIAEGISKAVTEAMQKYQNQQATLIQTLNALELQRQQAIQQLSGVKGGQAQLDKLLPQLDQEIAQLQLQIKQEMTNFTNSLQDMKLNNSALSEMFDKWQAINKEVQAYLSAGGDVSAANAYISASLAAMKKAAGDSLNQGYATAITDAQNLNNLIQQRMQLEQQEAQTEFGLINGDALERRGSKAINAGTQLQIQKAQFQQQLDNMNQQVDLTQQKVVLEGQMFDIAKSTADLQRTSNAIQIEQLKEQLDVLKAQKDIYSGITQGADGSYSASSTLMNQIGVVNINVTSGGTAGDDSAANPGNVADAVAGVLNTWSRSGMGTYIGKS